MRLANRNRQFVRLNKLFFFSVAVERSMPQISVTDRSMRRISATDRLTRRMSVHWKKKVVVSNKLEVAGGQPYMYAVN